MQNKLHGKQTSGMSCLWVLPSFLFLECLSTSKRVITCIYSDWHFSPVNYKLRCKKHNILVFKNIIWHVFVILPFIFWTGLAWEFWINRSFLNSSSILWDGYIASLSARPCDSPVLTNGRRQDENNTGPKKKRKKEKKKKKITQDLTQVCELLCSAEGWSSAGCARTHTHA